MCRYILVIAVYCVISEIEINYEIADIEVIQIKTEVTNSIGNTVKIKRDYKD